MIKNSTTAAEFDKHFDEGNDVSGHLNLENTERPGLKPKRVSVDFPEWMVAELDQISRRLGVTRQSVIKVFISDRLDSVFIFEIKGP
jgi:hypothetical protein